MTKKEKELLLKDLCMRLSYGVKVQIDFGEHCAKYGIDRYVDDTVICVWPETFEIGVNDEDQACDIEDVKPYLRPMSSMTEEEIDKMWNIWENNAASEAASKITDFLNEKHLDHHHLIEKGLALEAKEDMYKIE